MSTWSGKVLHESLPEGRAECTLRVERNALVALTGDGQEFRLPLHLLDFLRQGSSGDILAFQQRGTTQPRITTRDADVLAALSAEPAFTGAFNRQKEGQRQALMRKVVTPIALCVALAAGAVWFVQGPLVDLALVAIPLSADRELGKLAVDGVIEELGGKKGKVEDEQVLAVVKAVSAPLLEQVKDSGHTFEVHVVRAEMLNAFALPGGQVVLTTGLLRNAGSPEAVAGVLAHELSHVTERHAMRGILQRVGMVVLLNAVLGDVSAATTLIMDQASTLMGLSFSRQMESDADRLGVSLLRQAQLDPHGLKAFFQVMQQEEDGDSQEWQRFISTHPLTADRIQALDALTAEGGPSEVKPLDVDWKAFQALLAQPQPSPVAGENEP